MENFTSTISHEFRTPIATCLSFIDMLLSIIADEMQKKYLTLMQYSLNMLLTLVRDLLDLNSLKTGQFKVNPSAFNPFEAIKFVVDLLQT